MTDVFLSYARVDRVAAQQLHDHLTARGRSVFLDRRRLKPGMKWEPHLMAELRTARCVLVLWSSASVQSSWVRKEATSGYIRKRLVQALLEPIQPPEPFRSTQAADLTGWQGQASPELETLTAAVDQTIRVPPGAPQLVAQELDDLVQRLDSTAPEKQVGENLLLATWNVRALGGMTKKWTATRADSPRRDRRSLVAIAEVLRRFDLVVLQEVRGSLEGFDFVLSILGEEWATLVLGPARGPLGNAERTAFVFDTRRLTPHGLADRPDPPEGEDDWADLFVDVPYAAFFRTRVGTPSSTFGLLTLRVAYDKAVRDRDLHRLRDVTPWLSRWAEEERRVGRSLLLLGDFGIDRSGDPAYDALARGGVSVPAELQGVPRTLWEGDSALPHFVDHIGWMADEKGSPIMSLRYGGRAGHFDFVGTVHAEATKVELSWRVSDHYPIWIELVTPATLS